MIMSYEQREEGRREEIAYKIELLEEEINKYENLLEDKTDVEDIKYYKQKIEECRKAIIRYCE